MNIKDFVKGQIVYIYYKDKNQINDAIVTCVSNKYVTVRPNGYSWVLQYYIDRDLDTCLTEDWNTYLTEKCEYSCKSYLFQNKEDVHDYIEHKDIEEYVRKELTTYKLERINLEDLRKIKEIIERVDK